MREIQTEIIRLPKEITAQNSSQLWDIVISKIQASEKQTFDAQETLICDESGLSLIFEIRNNPDLFKLINLSASIEVIYEAMLKNFSPKDAKRQKLGFISSMGKILSDEFYVVKQSTIFLGECLCALMYLVFHPRKLRLGEILTVCDEAGSRAVLIICLIGFLMGIIIAFETALVAKIFGAVIFVVNGIGIAMTRELGPLMTAILFAGRSGSAFAAQLGTQKVNEELNALTTFGLDPIHFLVIPRLIASSITVPLLSIFATLLGVLGGGLVMRLYDITFTQFYIQLVSSISLNDLLLGLFKAVIFGFVIALIGCQCGINTGAGAAAVGSSTTKAVVRSIIWIVLIDGIAALLTNRLGI